MRANARSGAVVLTFLGVVLCGASAHATNFTDDFDRADGVVDGWTVNNGDWNIVGGELVGGPPTGPEQECFGGDPTITLPRNFRLSFDIRWIAPDPPGVIGRHAGVMFNFQDVTSRGAGSGYNLWWIDRAADRGLNIAKRTNGAFSLVAAGDGPAAPDAEPPSRWTIEVIGDRILVFGDGDLIHAVTDSTYRFGHFAFWTWNGEGQVVAYDNVVLESIAFADDFTRDPVRDWTVHQGAWEITDEQLVSGPASGGGAAGEHQAFAGEPPVELPTDYVVEFDWNFLSAGGGAVGNHAGILLNFNQIGTRWDGATRGYQVHWIDRETDKGLNLLRWDGGAIVALQAGTGDMFASPPGTVRVEVDGPTIRVFGDDMLAFEVDDDTYRGGITALWNWDGAENHVEWDNVSVTTGAGTEVFSDDFTAKPQRATGWTVHAGTWEIDDADNQRLIAGPTVGGGQAGEHQAFAGEPPVIIGTDQTISFDWELVAPSNNGVVGRHAGCFFAWNTPGIRWAAETNGYQLWWIDREADFGFSLAAWDGAGLRVLQAGTGDLFDDPPANIRIEMEGENIRVYGDDTLAIDVVDDTYRGGQFGLWAWDGADQVVAFDNVLIDGDEILVDACFNVVSAAPHVTGSPVSFDASCTFGQVDTYSWDFGDGTTGDGQTVDHSYDFAGVYTVELTATGPGGTSTATQEITVAEVVTDFADDFNRPDGAVDGWTIAQGDSWRLEGNTLAAGPTGSEFWIWAGDPPVVSEETAVFEFDVSYLAPGTVPAVGRHAGFQFCSNQPTTRGQFSGYFIDWIDRPADRGVRFTRVDNGGFNEIVRGQMAAATPDPPTRWKVVVAADIIQVFVGDADEPIFEVEDSTYRGGYFGFWTWTGGQEVEFDNLNVDQAPPTNHLAGDANGDSDLNVSDLIAYVNVLYPGFLLLAGASHTGPCGTAPGNVAVLDVDGNGGLNILDAIFLANYLFASGPPPAQGDGCFALDGGFLCTGSECVP